MRDHTLLNQPFNGGVLTFKTEQVQQFDIPISQLTPDSVERIEAKLAPSAAPTTASESSAAKPG